MNKDLGQFWRNCVYVAVLSSFVAANVGHEPALRLWSDAWESIMALVGSTVGLKYAKDVAMARANRGSADVDKGI